MDAVTADLSKLVEEWSAARNQSPAEIIQLVYKDLRRLAAAYLRRERPDHTLQATALVHEAYLRVFESAPFTWESRAHVIGTMARAMRQVLVDHARRHRSQKRDGGRKISFEDVQLASDAPLNEVIALNQAVDSLKALNDRQAQVVELRFFVGLTVQEAAEVLGISAETVKLDWRFAKAWLQNALAGSPDGDEPTATASAAS